jgi:radical SAM superfamily enzyme YgiQ (UPF0313 family)
MGTNGRVLFIIHDVYQDDNEFPLGPAYLAAILKREGAGVTVYCQDVFHNTNQELASFLDRNEFDIIGVGFLAARFTRTVLGLCEVINKHKKNAWLVLGGPGPTPIPEYMLEKTRADVVVLGEAEQTIAELLRCKINGGDLSSVPCVAYMYDDGISVNKRLPPVTDLDSIPFPEWSLFPMNKYTTCLSLFRMEKRDRVFGILTSRGCVNRCNFCYRMEHGIRFRSIDNVVEEIKVLNKTYGVNYLEMYDELFVVPKSRVFEFRDALEKNKLRIKFSCNARVDIFDEELARCLKECGCTFLNFGFESSHQNVLNLMNKHTTVEQNMTAAEIANKVGIGLGLNFIWGNKGDTEESLLDNVKLIKRFNTYDQIRTIRPVTPYPGSDLYYEAVQQGLLTGPEDFFNRFKNSDLLTVNFTDIPDAKFYELLFAANKDLIADHFMHTTKDAAAANKLIDAFRGLYFGGKTEFTGARHYERNDDE